MMRSPTQTVAATLTFARTDVFGFDLTDTILNVLLPSTDRVVFIQWIVCALFWPLHGEPRLVCHPDGPLTAQAFCDQL